MIPILKLSDILKININAKILFFLIKKNTKLKRK